MANTKCKVAMIGASRMARFHLEVLSQFKDVELVALASLTGSERAQALCKEFNIPHCEKDYKKMIAAHKPDAVVIAVKVDNNFEVTKYCLENGIPSLIEKPPAMTVEQTKTLKDIADKKKVVHLVGLQRRFSSHILKGLEIIKKAGPIYSIVVEAPEKFDEIKAKKKFSDDVLSGWIYNNGIHCIDMLPFVGGAITDIHAQRQQWDEKFHPDSLHALFSFKNNTIGHYMSNWQSPGGWSLKVYGKGCRMDVEPMERGKMIYADGRIEELAIDKIDIDYKPGLWAQNRMFIDACLGKSKISFPAATLDDALTVMKLAAFIKGDERSWS